MITEEKDLLLKDLCARLPYGVKVDVSRVEEWKGLTLTPFILSNYYDDIEKIKPYLRPMESMTDEEENEYRAINCYEGLFPRNEDALDYVLEHHFDYRGLIDKRLALEAPEGMYKTE